MWLVSAELILRPLRVDIVNGVPPPVLNTDQGVKQTRKGEDIVASTSLVLKGSRLADMVCTQMNAQHRLAPMLGLRLSVPVWTRKVVNYA